MGDPRRIAPFTHRTLASSALLNCRFEDAHALIRIFVSKGFMQRVGQEKTRGAPSPLFNFCDSWKGRAAMELLFPENPPTLAEQFGLEVDPEDRR